jgi:predicted membrane protein (TIGR00267 family)
LNLKKYLNLVRKDSIARRYFVMNSFDGCLTVMGIVIGAAVAMGVSGLWGAYSIEKAERIRDIRDLEKHLMRSLKNSKPRERVNELSMVLAIIDGLSPMIVSLLVITPFIFMSLPQAYYISLGMIGVTLFFLGIFVGKVAKENIVISGVKMILAGFLVGIIVIALEFVNVL